MNSLFSPDSRIMVAASHLADLMILNLLFLLTCIPIVTIGPSITAMYRVLFAIGTPREQGVLRPYFQAFRENFRPSLMVWLLIGFILVSLVFDISLASQLTGALGLFQVVFVILMILALIIMAYAFPLISFFENTLLGTIKTALALGLGHLPSTILILVMGLFPWFMLISTPLVFFNSAFFFIILYFSVTAYLSSLLLLRIFAPYLPKEELIGEDAQ